jgi:hypothetical protein
MCIEIVPPNNSQDMTVKLKTKEDKTSHANPIQYKTNLRLSQVVLFLTILFITNVPARSERTWANLNHIIVSRKLFFDQV